MKQQALMETQFYIGVFALTFMYASEQNLLYFAYILHTVVDLYFVIAGNILFNGFILCYLVPVTIVFAVVWVVVKRRTVEES